MPDKTLNKSKPRNPHPTVSDCAIIREEWAEYVRTCKHEPSWREIDRIQAFLVQTLSDKEELSALRSASLVDVMLPVMPVHQLRNSSLITFCAITEMFGILAEKSGKRMCSNGKNKSRKT